MNLFIVLFFFFLSILYCFSQSTIPVTGKIPVRSMDDLPSKNYKMPENPEGIFTSDEIFLRLISELKSDYANDIGQYAIDENWRLGRPYRLTLARIAIYENRPEEARRHLSVVRPLFPDPTFRIMFDIAERTVIAAKFKKGGNYRDNFRSAFREHILSLPITQYSGAFKNLREWYLLTWKINGSRYGDKVSVITQEGISKKDLDEVVYHRFMNDFLTPVEDIVVEELTTVLKKNIVKSPDVWTPRVFDLEKEEDLTAVVVAVWEAVDVSLFQKNLFVNKNEIPGNGIDDDANGYIDDVHGIGFTSQSKKTGNVFPTTEMTPQELEDAWLFRKGRFDILALRDTRESKALLKKIETITLEEWEKLWTNSANYALYYSHGTSVAGIALKGNPAMRLMPVASQMFKNYFQVDKLESISQEFTETIKYFEQHNVRVVNISWGVSELSIFNELTGHKPDLELEERKRISGHVYQLFSNLLQSAIETAPDVLFIASAGNEGEMLQAKNRVPAALEMTNLITTGNAEKSGQHASSSNYGKVDVYAWGESREVLAPGGKLIRGGGSSYAAPEVTNLAAKLLAICPDLTIPELKRLILEGAEERKIGQDGQGKLLHPRNSLRLLQLKYPCAKQMKRLLR